MKKNKFNVLRKCVSFVNEEDFTSFSNEASENVTGMDVRKRRKYSSEHYVLWLTGYGESLSLGEIIEHLC